MKGDFSRVTFDAMRHFSRVQVQQGRVTLDADSNEQTAILLHYLRTLARDLIGPCGGPAGALGFRLDVDTTARPQTISIEPGRYYVDGILCENDQACGYDQQPDFTPPADDPLLMALKAQATDTFWLYLDVWERSISYLEDDSIREVALGGPDTATRAKVVWQVKALQLDGERSPDDETLCTAPLSLLTPIGNVRMAAQLDPGQQDKDPCVLPPDVRFRGAENQLYRVQIHHGGPAGQATFKWSRDNASVGSAWTATEGNDLIVTSGRGFVAGDWVELSDDVAELRGKPGTLVKLTKVTGDRLTVNPTSAPDPASLVWSAALKNAKVTAWNQAENDDLTLDGGAVPIGETSEADQAWIDLEDGVRVQFAPAPGTGDSNYQSGDYWLIPARVATGSIDWPHTENDGDTTWDLMPPLGIQHHFAPLGVVSWSGGQLKFEKSCRCSIDPLSPCQSPDDAVPAPEPAPVPPPAAPPGNVPVLAPARRPVVKKRPRNPK